MAMQLMYTESEAVALTRLSRATLRRLEAQGLLSSVRIGRAVRYTHTELERFVRELEGERQGAASGK